jgi:polysaccharide export outer membrane protein
MVTVSPLKLAFVVLVTLCVALTSPLAAQAPAPAPPAAAQPAAAPPATVQPTLPTDYVIGAEDVLDIKFATGAEMSQVALVRPDGKISLPLVGDVHAAGLTPEQLATEVAKAGQAYVIGAKATVIVTEINSRRIYVVGEVTRPGRFPLGSDMTVLQAIGEAGGFVEGANKGDITIVRSENGQERRFKFNYNDVVRGRNSRQNIKLMPGDTILVR